MVKWVAPPSAEPPPPPVTASLAPCRLPPSRCLTSPSTNRTPCLAPPACLASCALLGLVNRYTGHCLQCWSPWRVPVWGYARGRAAPSEFCAEQLGPHTPLSSSMSSSHITATRVAAVVVGAVGAVALVRLARCALSGSRDRSSRRRGTVGDQHETAFPTAQWVCALRAVDAQSARPRIGSNVGAGPDTLAEVLAGDLGALYPAPHCTSTAHPVFLNPRCPPNPSVPPPSPDRL